MNNYTALLNHPKYSEEHLLFMSKRWVVSSGSFIYSPTTDYPPHKDSIGSIEVFLLWVLATIPDGQVNSVYRYYDTEEQMEAFKMLHDIG